MVGVFLLAIPRNDDVMKKTSGPLYIIGAAILWGTTGTSQALAPPGASSLSIGAVRLLVGGLALMAVAVARKGFRGKWNIVATVAAGAFVAVYQLSFFSAVARTGVAVGTIVAIGSSPIAAGLLGVVFRREIPGVSWLLSTSLAIAGCVLLSLGEGGVCVDPLGIVLALGAGASYAIYTLASKKLLERHSSESVMAVVFTVGAVLLLPLLLTEKLSWVATPGGVAVALHLGLVTTAAAYWLFARGLREIPVASAVTLSLAEPLTAAMLGIFFLHEPATLRTVMGMALVGAGVLLLAVNDRQGAATEEC
jgi:drug/metabolite transporter, DME family